MSFEHARIFPFSRGFPFHSTPPFSAKLVPRLLNFRAEVDDQRPDSIPSLGLCTTHVPALQIDLVHEVRGAERG